MGTSKSERLHRKRNELPKLDNEDVLDHDEIESVTLHGARG